MFACMIVLVLGVFTPFFCFCFTSLVGLIFTLATHTFFVNVGLPTLYDLRPIHRSEARVSLVCVNCIEGIFVCLFSFFCVLCCFVLCIWNMNQFHFSFLLLE